MSSITPTCQISIRGSFDVLWADYLGDTLLHADAEAGQVRTTTLFGKPPDLPAFIGNKLKCLPLRTQYLHQGQDAPGRRGSNPNRRVIIGTGALRRSLHDLPHLARAVQRIE